MKKNVLCIVLVFSVLGTASGCYYYADEDYAVAATAHPFPISPEISYDIDASETATDSDVIYEERTRYFGYENGTIKTETVKVPAVFANPENIFAVGSDVEEGGLQYKVNGSRVTQDKSALNVFTDLDADLFEGLYIPESSRYYIFVDMTIANLSDTEAEIYLNHLRFFGIAENLVIYESLGYLSEAGEYDFLGGEPRGLTNNQNTGKSLFKYVFEPHEILNTCLLFLTNDRTLDYDLYLSLDGTRNASTKFLKFYSKGDRP